MDECMPARMAEWEERGRSRIWRLRAEAHGERLARAARAAHRASAILTWNSSNDVRPAGVRTLGGSDT